ncbi:MAG: MerR family transcriptional regulator [Rhodospirillales bacterium]|nr:MerR family transcriptional regulator [Rhodospirillales bacterium]
MSRPAKSPAAFRTISEAAEDLGVPQHVLRFWETKFSSIRPLKRGGGRRYYRPEDINLLKKIHNLLYTEGYTIKGAQKFLKGAGRGTAAAPVSVPESVSAAPLLAEDVDDISSVSVMDALDSEVKSFQAPDSKEFFEDKNLDSPPKLTPFQREGLQAVLGELLELRGLLSVARA